MMLLTVHNLAKTYKLLPSEVLGRATTFDLYILDSYHRYVKYQEAKEKGQSLAPRRPKLSQEQLKQMLERAKNFKHPRERKK